MTAAAKDHVSYSELGLWRTCQWRWKLDVLEGRKSKTHSEQLLFGTAVHDTLELLKAKDVSRRPSIETACATFEAVLRVSLIEHAQEVGPVDVDALISAGKRILEHVDDLPELRDFEVVFNEYELAVPIERTDGVEIKFKGFIDVVLKGTDKRGKTILYVCDYKTCTWGWGSDKRRDEWVHRQLLFYKHFLCKRFKLDPKHVRTAFILLKKTPKGPDVVDLFQIPSGPKAIADALDELNSDVSGMLSGTYTKNEQACVNRYGDRCPYDGTDLCQRKESCQ